MPGLFWRRERHCLSVPRPERKPGVAIQRGQLHLPCQHTEVHGDQRGRSEADHEDMHRDRQTDLDLEEEVT